MGESRSYRIDALKGIAILAVVLYHFGGGYLPFGYLGVDIFFVISGYFMMKSIVKAMQNGSFGYWRFLIGRVTRLWPLVLIMAAISLGLGYFLMLPDDFENLAESVIASNVFANNILACITTKNYWDIANVFKPLMHTWYVGVLMQAYVILPAVYAAAFKLSKGKINAVKIAAWGITLLSLAAYILPVATSAQKFYYLPYRAFEITIGSLLVFAPKLKAPREKLLRAVKIVYLAVILLLLCLNFDIPTASAKLLLVVFVTAILLWLFENSEERQVPVVKAFALLGKASLSIYLCHQVVVAYMYYAVTASTGIRTLLLYLAAVAVLSAAVYLLAEKPLGKLAKKNAVCILIPAVVLCCITSVLSGLVYLNAGVVRDVPELGIDKTNVHRGMHAEYCDIPYAWDRDFSDSDKIKIAVIGDSFGRDWANILNESSISDKIEISYIFPHSAEYMEKRQARFAEADLVFRTFSSSTADVSGYLPSKVPKEKLYIVGYKNFGSSNGILYSRRGDADYFDQTIKLDAEVLANNRILSEQYGDHYIDMIGAVQNADGSVRVFTDDGHFISQDCRHLTKYGAQYYARIIDLSWITDGK